MKRGKTLLALFWEFFQFGCFTFGGGWSIVAQMQRLYVEKRKTITGRSCWTSPAWAAACPAP